MVLADAVHSLTDFINNLIAWTVLKIADRPPDESHPYGHRKFEVLAVFALATLLSVIAFELVANAFRRSDEIQVFSANWMLALMIGVLAVNLATAVWQKKMANMFDSRILAADASHTFTDVLTTVGAIAGWQFAANGFPILDSIATLIVAGVIVWMSFSLFRTTLPILVDEAAVPSTEIRELVVHIPGIESIQRVRSRWVGDTISVDLIVTVDPSMITSDAHAIADLVERVIAKQYTDADTTVHIEPHPQTKGSSQGERR